jgi:predicted nucleic acid-binding protein
MIAPYHASYVLDASVAFKWFSMRREQNWEVALALRDRHVAGKCRLIVPHFFFLEMLSVIRFHTPATEEDASRTLEVLEHLNLKIEPLSPDLLRKTNAISWSYGTSIYNAAYVALAEIVGFPLVTADDALVKKMRGYSIVLRLKDLSLS